MKRKSQLHKLTAWLLTLAMMLSVMQGLTLVTFAATTADSYDYKIKVKNSGDKKSGTDADVFCIVKTHTGAKHQVKIDSGANDFEKNDCREYNVNLECQPWEIKEVGLRNSGKDGMKVAWFEWKNPDGSIVRKEIHEWFENQKNKIAEHTYSVWASVDRQVKTTGNFDSQFSGNKYFAPGTKTGQSDIVMQWNGKVTDQYFNSEYNFFKYYGATGVDFYPSATSYGYSGISSVDGLTNNNLAKIEAVNSEGFDNKITLYTNRLLDFMQRNEIFKLNLKSEIDYMYESDEYAYHNQNYTITRTGFKLENASVITAAYIPQENKNFKDSRFFNSNPKYKTFEIKIPVKDMNNYNASTVASSLVSNIKNKASLAKIYYDRIDTGRYITPKNAYTSGANIYLVCDVPSDFANPEGIGLTVVIENPKATYNNQTYTLFQRNEDGQFVTNYEYKISTHKVDTKGLTHTVKDDKDKVINPSTGFDNYTKEHQFKLEVDPGQKIFIDNNKGGRTEGNFSYRLYSKDRKSEIELVKHNGLVATSNVPHTGGTTYKIASANNVEGEYTLTITSKDLANNLSTTNIPVKLDNLAPRATHTVKQVDPIDGSRRNEYNFNIEDASGTGKLHYVFVRNGQELPDANNTKPDSSGPQDTVYEKWGFISQTNSNAQTVVLNLAKGDYFKGRLYWYTDDEAGNDSRKESKTGKDGNGYYYKDIELSNVSAECEIILNDVTPGKPDYDIEFKTNYLNKVLYRWISNSLTTPYFEYTSSSVPGNNVQKNGSGDSVTMNGDYTLEYRVTTPDGTKRSYTKEFTFDNSSPDISFESQDKALTESRNITITAKDISNIETIKYQLLTSSGEMIGEETVLPAGLPVVSNEVVLTPEKTGAYKIKVTATDVNGQSSEKESFIFSIRNSAPQIEAENNIKAYINGIPVTNSQIYNINFSVSETVENLSDFDENQVLQYRTSGDGVNYSDWTVMTDVNYNSSDNELFAEVDLESPVALNEGDNRVYIQAMFTEKGTDASKVRNEFIATNSEMIIIYDTEAPQYKLEIDNVTMTNKRLPGTLSITDNYTAANEISFENKVAAYCDSTELSVSDMLKVISLEFLINTEEKVAFVLKDIAGNVAEIPIAINCIDYDPPKIEAENSVHINNGERRDFYLSFWIDEAMEEKTKFALVETEDYEVAPMPTYGAELPDMDNAPEVDPSKIDDSLFGPLPDNIEVINKETQYDYENGEKKTYYELQVYADEEQFPDVPEDDETYWEKYWAMNNKKYILASKTEDALGNSAKQSVGYAMQLNNATARVQDAYCIPEKAGTKSVVYLRTSVPVYLMPESKVPAEMKTLDDGRIDTITDAAVEEFAESVVNNVSEYSQNVAFTVSELGEHPVFFTDECGRVYKETIKVKPLAERETDEDYANSVYVDFGVEAPVTATLYEAAYEDYEPLNWTEKSTDNLRALELEGDYSYFVVLEGNNDTVGFDSSYFESSGGYEDPDFEMIEGLSEFDYDTYNYKKLVFEVNNTPNSNRFVSSTVYYTNEGVEETAGFVYELDLVDVTAPIVDAYYSTKGYTKDPVKVTISATDPELSISTDAGDSNPAGSDPQAGEAVVSKPALSSEALAKNAGIASIEISEITATKPADYTSLSYSNLGQVAETVVTFEDNGYAVVRVTNTEGLVSYKEIEVNNINSNPIEKDVHYFVSYHYINNEGIENTCDPDAYYKEVIAKVRFSDEAKERELAVINNNLENTRILNSFDNTFVFKLQDKFGHTADVDVAFSRFDTTGPIADFELLNKAKTNQPVEVELKATDLLSTAAGASLTDSNGQEIPVSFDRDETDSETSLVTKVFKAEIPDSGFYKMTVTDILGNETHKNFSVTNIDKTDPYVVETKATSVEPTRQSVGVKLYYSEPNVVITKVELNESSSFTADDISVDYNNSVVRFYENGTVTVWYADDYGNECEDAAAEVITVGNIIRTEPSLSAVTEPAEDELSVYVQFTKNPEEMRDLSELYVMYGGTSPVITDEATGEERIATAADMVKTSDGKDFRFRFYDNGTYTFYVYDAIGNIQELPVEITGIDRKAPVITEVKWSYSYFDADGNEKEVIHTITPGDEAGYNVVEDEKYLPTNQDITATVTTDDPTKFAGSSTNEYTTTHSIVYDEDGWFNFDLQKRNNLMDRYGLGLYLIDKEPPVIEGVEDLMFFENETANAAPYSKDLLKYSAYDERNGVKTDLTGAVEIDWGGFNPDNIKANTFDKNKPYTITYKVKDKVGNITSVNRKITLVGLFDTMIRVNGKYPDSSGRIEVIGDTVEIALDNFGGTAYARYEKGIYTMGEMKHMGTVIAPTGDKFKLDKLTDGWYTFYVQTDLKDYFCVNVYIFSK